MRTQYDKVISALVSKSEMDLRNQVSQFQRRVEDILQVYRERHAETKAKVVKLGN